METLKIEEMMGENEKYLELGKRINTALSELTLAIKEFEIDGYCENTKISWRNDSLVIEMFGLFGITGMIANPELFKK